MAPRDHAGRELLQEPGNEAGQDDEGEIMKKQYDGMVVNERYDFWNEHGIIQLYDKRADVFYPRVNMYATDGVWFDDFMYNRKLFIKRDPSTKMLKLDKVYLERKSLQEVSE